MSLQFYPDLWYVIGYRIYGMLLAIPLTAEMLSKKLRDVKEILEMCVSRFEERPKKFNEGSAVRLIDVLRKQNTEKPDRAPDLLKSVVVA